MSNFTWVPFYKELASKLLSFKDNRSGLVARIKKINPERIAFLTAVAENGNFNDIDPFTVFAIFNRSSGVEKRIEILRSIKENFQIESNVPTGFDGIPILNSQKSCFYWEDEKIETIPLLWKLFEAFMNNDSTKIAELFDEAQKQKGIKWNLTIAFFWMKPDECPPMDRLSRIFLNKECGLKLKENQVSYAVYEKAAEKVKDLVGAGNKSYHNIYEFSDAAFCYADQVQRIWIAGTSFGKPRENKIDIFVKDGYWEGGECDTEKNIKQVKTGDILIGSTCSTKGPGHKLPFLKVYGIGLVQSDMQVDANNPRWFSCDVDWVRVSPEIDFDGHKYGQYQKTMQECDPNLKELIAFAKEKLEMVPVELPENGMNEYTKYVEFLKNNHNIILHGAPGTGKTYLAKQIAKAMDCSENEIGFVQFHQSYDYTDFVEGLRPAGKGGTAECFKLTDGVFKKFCEKALGNNIPVDSENESVLKQAYDSLIEKIEDGEIDSLKQKSGDEIFVHSISPNGNIVLQSADVKEKKINADRTYTASFNRLERLSKKYNTIDSLNSISNINDSFNKVIGGSNASALWAVLKKLLEIRDELKKEIKTRKDYVFIIDEINRGEMSKIFGELFYSIDPGYRGEKGRILTQYASMQQDKGKPNDYDIALKTTEFGHFFVPENVYIIGTMNDIDRSVESMDFAMRRRFAFMEIKAEDRIEMLKDPENGIPDYAKAITRMKNLNVAIEKIETLSSAYDIGPAYFLKLKNYNGDFEKLWKYHLEGILKEYLRGMDNDGKLLAGLKEAYDNEANT